MKTIKSLFISAIFFFNYSNILPSDLLENINTPYNEFSPSVSPDGKFMLFNSKRNGDKYQDIYISFFLNGIWSKPRKFDILNSPYDDETPFISADRQTILFASNRDGSTEKRLRDGHTLVSYDIYWSRLDGNHWTVPEKMPGDVNTGDHERAPSLSKDNKTLYFTRWAKGEIEQTAVYSAVYDHGRFVNSIRLPDSINSGNQEVALLPDPEGNGLYFSSMRKGGIGGWDIYFISYRNGQYGMPVNLGDKINTPGNDAFFSIYNGQIYFCTDFESKNSDYNIAEKYLPGRQKIDFTVIDPDGTPLVTSVDIEKEENKGSKKNSRLETGSNGNFSIQLDDDTESVNIFIEKEGYLPFYKRIDKYEFFSPKQDIVLTPNSHDNSFSIEAIYFDYDSHQIKPESFVFLDRLVKYMKSKPDLKLQIIGHTDLHGDDAYNIALSKNRADEVKKYLMDHGISKERLESTGLGKTRPVMDEINDHADKLNRRTEFRVF